MIDSTIIVRDDMVEINLEYAREIEEFISQMEASKKPQTEKTKERKENTALSTELKESQLADSKKAGGKTGEHQSSSNYEPPTKLVDNAPLWAKSLWKKIAMKCHPDRLNFQKLTAIEIAKRQQYLLDSRKAYEEANWKQLLFIGIQLGEFVDDLKSSEQFSMLETEYNLVTSKVNTVQNSLAWQWGQSWQNMGLRVRIVQQCYMNAGKKSPSREQIIEALIKFEQE